MADLNTFAPINDLGEGDALKSWRFLVGANAQVRLLTSMGDVFLLKPHGLLTPGYVNWHAGSDRGELGIVQATHRGTRSRGSVLA